MKKTIDKEKALQSLSSLCSRSEQCEFDCRKKLMLKGLSRSDIDEVITTLISLQFIDDARFARSFANDKVRFSKWGKIKIRTALSAKRISPMHIAQALEQIDESEYFDALERTIASVSKKYDLNQYNDRQKLYRYLLSRGFESHIVSESIKKLMRST